jgi:hypothetical protein
MYPVTIVATRYSGTYEGSEQDSEGNLVGGGKWAAFNCEPDEISGDAFGGDTVAAGWWAKFRERGSIPHPSRPGERLLVGFGATPDEAFAALAAAVSK